MLQSSRDSQRDGVLPIIFFPLLDPAGEPICRITDSPPAIAIAIRVQPVEQLFSDERIAEPVLREE
jgi:hypothetical protein